MKGILAVVTIASAVWMAVPHQVDAQTLPLAFEVRGGAAFPIGDFGNDLRTGFAYGASLGYRVIPSLTVFGGYSEMNFGSEGTALTRDVRSSGFDVGAQFALPVPVVDPYLRAGLTFQELRDEQNVTGVFGAGVTETRSTDRSTGFEIGGGVRLPLWDMFSVTPGIRYVNYGVSGWDTSVTAVVADVGLRVALP